jgi:hypothetical protein
MGKEVDPSEFLYRSIITCGASRQIKYDEVKGIWRPSSYAFSDARGELSVDIASKTTPEESLRRRPKSGALATFQAEIPISLKYPVEEDPIKNDPDKPDNPAHALVLSGNKPMTHSHRRIIAQQCSWAIPPTDI